jgi:type VI secretion system protein ImpL
VLKYIFAAVFIALAWALVLVFRDVLPLWPAIVATAVIVTGLATYVIVKLVLAKRAASAIEAGLKGQGAGGGMRPDQQAQVEAMQAEFQKAVQSLKSSKVGRSGRDSLGLLPWYVMIGPPGSGKTTAIRSSGLKFPQGRNSVVKGVGGTRNCDWWMTNEAILLDTAGRWSTDDEDGEEWLAFLDLLKKTRPKKPINGIMVAVSVKTLQESDEQIAELAGKLRERIDEVIGRLDTVVPVYLLITMCDLVSGFVETFGDLKDRDRGQIFGFTLPLINETGDRVQEFGQHFDELLEVAERYSFLRMGEERRVDARERIYTFPQQFDSLRQGLIDLVGNLFDSSVYHDGPIMRGVYFTSGTQEGRPIDRVMANMAQAFGVRPKVATAPPTKPKSYFVRDVLRRVVFPDHDVAVSSSRVQRRQRVARWAMAGAAVVASVAFLVLPISSYLENMRFVSEGRSFVERLARARTEPGAKGPLGATSLEGAEPMATRLASFAAHGPDVSLRFGLYPGDRLMIPLHTAVEQLVVRPILDADGQRLLDFARARGDTDASGALGGLMLQLLLTQPKASDEPAPEGDGWADRWIGLTAEQAASRWAELSGGGATTRSQRAIENSVRFYLLRIETAADLVERRADVVSRVRTALLGANEGDPLADLLRDPNMPRDVRLIDIVGGAVTVFQGGDDQKKGPSVPGAFTPEGWAIIKGRLERLTADREHDENGWVLGANRRRNDIDAAAVQAAYFRRYVDVWKTFLLSLSLREPTRIDEIRSLLKALVMQKPLEAIWRNASKDLIWKDETPLLAAALAKGKGVLAKKLGALKKKVTGGDKDKDKDKDDSDAGGHRGPRARAEEPTTPEDVGAEFAAFLNFGLTKPTGLEAYGQVLTELSGAIGEQGTPDSKAFEGTVKAQRVKLSNLIASYNENGWEAGLLEKILMPPLRGAEVAVSGATGESANRKWCGGVVVIFDQLLAGRYPFTSNRGARDVRVADVDKFFQPKTGVLWQYFTDALAADIDRPSGTSLFHVREGVNVKYRPGLLTFLKRSQELTDLLYSKDPAKVGIAMAIRLRSSAPYTKIVFESGGRKVTYINTKERWDDLVWPARGALFRFYQKSSEGEMGYTDGEWALFHLIEDGRVASASDGEEYLTGTWNPPLGEGAIRADLKPAGMLRAFRGLDLPRAVVGGASGCGR